MQRIAILTCALWLAGEAAGADEPVAEVPACARDAVAAVQKRYESATDLKAGFEQTTRSVALGGAGATQRSSGRVVFAKPGKMRWSYESPEPSLVVSDGRWLWIYDPVHAEAQKLPVGEGFLSAAAVQFLLGEGDILRDFAVAERACDASRAELELTPHRPASYETLRVTVDPATGDLLETEVVDLLGNVTRVAFESIEIDSGTAPELFRFEPPPGTEVIELEPVAP